MIIWTAMLFILMSWATVFSQVDRCGESPPVADDSLKGAVKGEAQALSRWLGRAELSGEIQTSRKEIFSNYPQAEVSRWNAYFQFQVCVLIMRDKSLTTPQKIALLIEIQREFSKPFPQPPPPVEPGNILAELREDRRGDWFINGNNYNLVNSRLMAQGLFTASVRNSKWDEYAVEFEVKELKYSGYHLDILVRRQSDNDYVGLQLRAWPNCGSRWVIVRERRETIAVNSEMSHDCAGRYRIEVEGNRYTLFKDGSQMFVLNNNTFASGGVGLKSVEGGYGGIVTFDINNFKVVSLHQ